MQINLQESVLRKKKIEKREENKRQGRQYVYGFYSLTPSLASSFPFYSLSRAAKEPKSKPL